ncbi:MAG TPA: hypothetical protein V6D47_12865 [Oscillatoriaceae cyanobacterium]
MGQVTSFYASQPVSRRITAWFNGLADEIGADGFSLFKLYVRYSNYYVARIPNLRAIRGLPRMEGQCPLCGGAIAINSMSGWWECEGCSRKGEPYTMEYLLTGQDDPLRWDACRHEVDMLMAGTQEELA